MKKKILITVAVTCLGLGAGMYTAAHMDNFPKVLPQKKEKPKTWEVSHPNWTGTFIKEGDNRIYLTTTGDYATIVSDENGILTVKWDNWGTESFACDQDLKCTFKK